jgi:hypothetical protein
MTTILRLLAAAAFVLVGLDLAVAGLLKLRPADPAPGGGLARRGWLPALGAAELALAVGWWIGALGARLAVGALCVGFAAWHGRALMAGRDGQPCSCHGGRTAIGRGSAAHAALLATAATAVALAGPPRVSTVAWLSVVVAVLGAATAGLGALSWSLARDVAVLGHAARSGGALEIAGEGPALGAPSPLAERFAMSGGEIALAVFLSPGCALCAELAPAVRALSEHPGVQVVVFDEAREPLAWTAASVPGSPYAVAISADGRVRAKGTFNTAEQLHSVVGAALWRQAAAAAGSPQPLAGGPLAV